MATRYHPPKLIAALEQALRDEWSTMHRARRNRRIALDNNDSPAHKASTWAAWQAERTLTVLLGIRRVGRLPGETQR